MLFDTHAHLNDEHYEDSIVEIDRMFDNGVGGCIIVGCDRDSSISAAKLTKHRDNVYATVGIHPQEANEWNDETRELITRLADDDNVVAIGEIGLDYHYENYPREMQKEVFIEQLKLADKLKLPVVLHIRDAMGDSLEIIKDNLKLINNSGVVHSYSGSIETADILMKYGFYFSFNGVITFKNANNVLKVVEHIPMDRILIETDCPYLTPVPFRGQLNRPENVKFVAMKIAEIKGLTLDEVIEQSYNNAKKLFKRMK